MLTVDSPHIIRLFDYFYDGTFFWMVLERASHTLREQIAVNGPLPEEGVVVAGSHLFSALRELHAKRIVHRDLHIDNILWSMRRGVGYLKIADFGIAKQLVAADGMAVTQVGRQYDVAPDLHLLGYSTHQSDLYQVGLAMYFMVVGAEALGVADGTAKNAILSGVARERAESLGTPIGDFISVLLRRRAAYRFSNAIEAQQELDATARHYGVV